MKVGYQKASSVTRKLPKPAKDVDMYVLGQVLVFEEGNVEHRVFLSPSQWAHLERAASSRKGNAL